MVSCCRVDVCVIASLGSRRGRGPSYNAGSASHTTTVEDNRSQEEQHAENHARCSIRVARRSRRPSFRFRCSCPWLPSGSFFFQMEGALFSGYSHTSTRRSGSRRAHRSRWRWRSHRGSDRHGSMSYFVAGKGEFEEAEEIDEGLGPTAELGQLRQLPFATGDWRHKPRCESAGGVRQQERRHRRPSVVHHRRWAGARSQIRLEPPTARRMAASTRCSRLPGVPAQDGCNLAQPDFERQVANRNVIFRIPTPTFGLGLVEEIPDSAIAREHDRQRGRQRARLAYVGGRISLSRAEPSADRRTTTATTAPSPASDGRRRTSRCCCSPARPTTSKWASATSCSRRNVTRRQTVCRQAIRIASRTPRRRPLSRR